MAEWPVAVYILRPPIQILSPLMIICLWSGELGFESLSRNQRPSADRGPRAIDARGPATDTEPILSVVGPEKPCMTAASGRALDRAIGAALLVTIVALIVGLLFAPRTAHAARLHPDVTCRAANLTATKAIRCYWPANSGAKALQIAECESTASAPERIARRRGLGRWARNGIHVGIFQMGIRERRAHGWYERGAPARDQVRSAISLYHDRGWQPWSCA